MIGAVSSLLFERQNHRGHGSLLFPEAVNGNDAQSGLCRENIFKETWMHGRSLRKAATCMKDTKAFGNAV